VVAAAELGFEPSARYCVASLTEAAGWLLGE
jgi:hypothetical protein